MTITGPELSKIADPMDSAWQTATAVQVEPGKSTAIPGVRIGFSLQEAPAADNNNSLTSAFNAAVANEPLAPTVTAPEIQVEAPAVTNAGGMKLG